MRGSEGGGGGVSAPASGRGACTAQDLNQAWGVCLAACVQPLSKKSDREDDSSGSFAKGPPTPTQDLQEKKRRFPPPSIRSVESRHVSGLTIYSHLVVYVTHATQQPRRPFFPIPVTSRRCRAGQSTWAGH